MKRRGTEFFSIILLISSKSGKMFCKCNVPKTLTFSRLFWKFQIDCLDPRFSKTRNATHSTSQESAKSQSYKQNQLIYTWKEDQLIYTCKEDQVIYTFKEDQVIYTCKEDQLIYTEKKISWFIPVKKISWFIPVKKISWLWRWSADQMREWRNKKIERNY